MLELHHLLILACLVAAAYYLVAAIRLKEDTYRVVKAHCEQEAVQLLDGTIYLARIRPGRSRRNHLALKREYRFEFTVTGAERYPGKVKLAGNKIETVELAPHRVP